MFSAFPLCSQMPLVFYHSIINRQLRLLYLLNNNFIHCSSIILTGLARGSLSLFMNATSVKVGYLWDTPRDENLHTSEVVMEKEHGGSVLRLICSISPPLPTDEHHWELRNELVQWYKNGPKGETFENPRYWSDDMTRTAISFVKVTLDVLGTYSCSYGGLTSSIDVLGKNLYVRILYVECGCMRNIHGL